MFSKSYSSISKNIFIKVWSSNSAGTNLGPFLAPYFPADPFKILDRQYLEISVFYLVQERRATDFEAPKLGKGQSGSVDSQVVGKGGIRAWFKARH